VLASCPEAPREIVTDELRSYPAAKAEIPELAHVKHVFVKACARVNNRAENSHQPTRERERRIRGFRDPERTQAFSSSFSPIRQHFALKRHLLRASLYRTQLALRFAAWHRFTEAICYLISAVGRLPRSKIAEDRAMSLRLRRVTHYYRHILNLQVHQCRTQGFPMCVEGE
jgi:hypothetical protein